MCASCSYSDPDSFGLSRNSKVRSVETAGGKTTIESLALGAALSVDSCSRYVVMYIYDNPNVLKAYLASAEPDKASAPRHS